MKRTIKSGIIALATIAAIGSAFATSYRPHRPDSVTYYAIRQGTDNATFHWSTSVPSGDACQEGNPTNACRVISADGSAPMDNSVPSGDPNFTVQSSGNLYYPL